MNYDGYFETEEEREGWQVMNAGAANWAVEKIREAENNIQKAKKSATNFIMRRRKFFKRIFSRQRMTLNFLLAS